MAVASTACPVAGGAEAAERIKKWLTPLLIEPAVEADIMCTLYRVKSTAAEVSIDAFVFEPGENVTLDEYVGEIVTAAEEDVTDCGGGVVAYAVRADQRAGRCAFTLDAPLDVSEEDGFSDAAERLVGRYDRLVGRYEQAEALRVQGMVAARERTEAFSNGALAIAKQLLPMLLEKLLPHAAAGATLPLEKLDEILTSIEGDPERGAAFLALLQSNEITALQELHMILAGYRAAKAAARDVTAAREARGEAPEPPPNGVAAQAARHDEEARRTGDAVVYAIVRDLKDENARLRERSRQLEESIANLRNGAAGPPV